MKNYIAASLPFLFSLTLALGPLTSAAQEAQVPSPANHDEQIENITVHGSDQLSVLKYNVYRAEEDFFALFNELVSNKDFHITCENKKRHAFTRIKHRGCESKYQDEASFEVTQTAIRGNPGDWMSRLPLQGEEYREQRRMKKKQVEVMKKLVQENPELLAKLVALNEAKTKYEEAKAAN